MEIQNSYEYCVLHIPTLFTINIICMIVLYKHLYIRKI